MTARDAQRPPAAAPAGEQVVGGRHDQSTAWLAGELATVADMLQAARLALKAGHLPVVHLRRAAVRLAALDAAVGDDLSLVRIMRAESEAVST